MDNELALMQELTDTQGPSFSVYLIMIMFSFTFHYIIE